jgi:putative nucleotidyltransferase with HDIG domain
MSSELEDELRKTIKEVFRPADYSPETVYQDKPEILKQIKEYEEKVRSQFLIPEGPLPKCLQVFWDRVQEKPRMAVASEVMSKEILKSIKADPLRFVEMMDEVGGLKVILPELSSLKNLAQPKEYHREGDAFRHTLMVLSALPSEAKLRLKLATLFHDLGKAVTQKIDENGKITFHGHAQKSAELTRNIANRFRFTDKLKKEVVWLVENHMLCLSSDVGKVKKSKLEKMFLEDEELGKDLFTLSRADATASIPANGKPNLESVNILLERIEEIKKLREEKNQEIPRLVTGKDLIEMGFESGPKFTHILDEIRNAQLEGKIKSKKEGIELAKKTIRQLTR